MQSAFFRHTAQNTGLLTKDENNMNPNANIHDLNYNTNNNLFSFFQAKEEEYKAKNGNDSEHDQLG